MSNLKSIKTQDLISELIGRGIRFDCGIYYIPDNCIILNGELVLEFETLTEVEKIEDFIKTFNE